MECDETDTNDHTIPMTQDRSVSENCSEISLKGDCLLTSDCHGNITALTTSAELLLGWGEQEAVGLPLGEVLQIIHTQPDQGIDCFLDQVRQTGQIFLMPQPLILITRNGIRRPIDGKIVPMKGDKQQLLGMIVILQDLIEKQDAELARQKANQMDSLSFMASGVAHDLNNLLTAILGNLTLVKSWTDPDNPAFTRIDETEKAAIRAQQVSRRLFKLSQESPQLPTTCSIKKLLVEAAEFAVSGSNVRCECDIAENLWLVHIDESQITQVIYNLVINAKQAMPDGGTLKISAVNESILLEDSQNPKEKTYVKVTVADNGIGIAPEHLPKIFDPYFTTKRHGTGLGLAITDAIIRNHHGSTRVESIKEKGTTISIYLPAICKTIPDHPDDQPPLPYPRQGKILVLDDDIAVLKMVTGMLNSRGYTTELAQTGEQAIRLYRDALKAKQPFDACLLDLTIPGGMGGKEIIVELRNIHPQVKAILSSGHTYDSILENCTSYGFLSALPKPYTLTQLITTLEYVLGQQNIAQARSR